MYIYCRLSLQMHIYAQSDSLPMLPLPPEYIAVGTGTPLPFGVKTWSCMPVDPGPRGIYINILDIALAYRVAAL